MKKKRIQLSEKGKFEYRKNAKMMIKKDDHKRNKNTREFLMKENMFQISRLHRGYFTRLSYKVRKISSLKEAYYRILTDILNDDYRAGDLESFSGIVKLY